MARLWSAFGRVGFSSVLIMGRIVYRAPHCRPRLRLGSNFCVGRPCGHRAAPQHGPFMARKRSSAASACRPPLRGERIGHGHTAIGAVDPYRTRGLPIADRESRPLSQPLAGAGRKSYSECLGLEGGARVSPAASTPAWSPAGRTGPRKTRNNFITDADVVSTACAISCFGRDTDSSRARKSARAGPAR